MVSHSTSSSFIGLVSTSFLLVGVAAEILYVWGRKGLEIITLFLVETNLDNGLIIVKDIPLLMHPRI